MKRISLLIFIAVAFIASGCGGKGKTTCSPLVFTTSSTTVKCDKIQFSDHQLPKDQLLFMATAYTRVSEEASQGQGEYLDTLSTLLKCDDTALLAQEIRSHYSTIFNNESDPVNSLREIHVLVKSMPALQNSCSLKGS